MKSKEEIEAVRDALAQHRSAKSQTDTKFEQGLVCGAVDALSWAMGQANQTTDFFGKYAEIQTQKIKAKKQKVAGDSFSA